MRRVRPNRITNSLSRLELDYIILHTLRPIAKALRPHYGRGWRTAYRLGLTLLVCLSVPGFLPAQARSHQPRSRAAASTHSHFGIMGAVNRPGTYELSKRFPGLLELIQTAGGLTTHASGNIRIVRNGRAGHQTYYTPSLRLNLLPGDLVIVDDKRHPSLAQNVLQRDQAESGAVQLAFVHLVDRPVVLNVRREDATLQRIISHLRQSPEIAGSIQIIGRQHVSTPTNDVMLNSGTALVFDPSQVVYALMPPLPVPLRSPAPKAAVAPGQLSTNQRPVGGIEAVNTLSPPTPRLPLRQPLAVPQESVAPKQHAQSDSQPARDQLAPPSLGNTNLNAGLNIPNPARTLTKSTASKRSSLLPSANNLQPTASTHRTPVSQPRLQFESSRAKIDQLPTSAEAQKSSQPSPPPITKRVAPEPLAATSTATVARQDESPFQTAAIWVALCVILSVGGTVWWVRTRRRTTVSQPAPRQDQPHEGLDDLIKNQLPVAQEQLQHPSAVKFFGQVTQPKTFRVDSEHRTPAPHLPKQRTPRKQVKIAASARPAPTIVNDQHDVVQPVGPQRFVVHSGDDDRKPSPHQTTVVAEPVGDVPDVPTYGLLDRALADVHRK